MARKMKKTALTPEERLRAALVPEGEQPYSVPGNWCWVHLGDFIDYATDYVANGSFASLRENVKYYKEENYAILVKTQDFANSFSKDLTYTDEHGYRFLKKSALFGGELILSNIGSIGKVFRVPYLQKSMTLAPNSIMIKCHRASDYDWLYYYFLSPFGFEELMSIATGTALLKFNKKQLKTLRLPLPPLTEQQRIVTRIESLFAKLDEAKEKVQAALDSFEPRKAAVLHRAFSGELTEEWRCNHPDKAKEWVPTSSKNLFEYVTSGSRGWAQYYSNEGAVFIRMGNLDHGTIELDMSDIQYVQLPDRAEGQRSRVQQGDILISITADIGMVGYVRSIDYEAYINQHIALARPLQIYNGEFVAWYLVSDVGLQQMKSKERGATKKGLGLDDIRNLALKMPSLDEQAEIVRILDAFFEQESQAKAQAEAALEAIDTTKKSILAKAFRGELGTNDPAEESAEALLKNQFEQ